jgi:glycyl-tRNA synthetase
LAFASSAAQTVALATQCVHLFSAGRALFARIIWHAALMDTIHPLMLTFQDLILTLQQFWASKGCLLWQPYNQNVGAGTMNPATFLRVLGPEPWNVAYVEPSTRPDDGRFGENPNRLYTHTQFQVIVKPSPERSQDLYLESLRAIGVDPSKHDIRFVEDNWAQPAIGAWGLGWEVWLDGLEITQYTYFQQVGGLTLDPACLEITYGLERIAMALQNVRSVFDLKWDNLRTYGDVKLQDEQERSAYAFNEADVEELHELFEKYEREGRRTIERGLVLPSHDYVLQCSNVFNLLDTRGAIGVTERARFLGRIRDLAREVATKYVEQREKLGHPWLKKSAESGVPSAESVSQTTAFSTQHPTPGTRNSELLLELGVEELPADNVTSARDQLGTLLVEALAAARIEHGGVQLFATPRRVTALVAAVAPTTRAFDEWVKGPGAKASFDAAGNPTQAAIGFAKRFGIDPKELVVKTEGNASYVYARKQEAGRPSGEVLAGVLPQVIGKLSFEKTMRWNASNVPFARPVNWIVALLGEAVIPFSFAGVASGNVSIGPRGEGSPEFAIKTAADYPALLAQHKIMGDIAARKVEVKRQIDAVAASIGATVAPDDDLLDEVANLVEQPTALLCDFDAEFLKIPAQVLVSVMSKKQRYFTVLGPDGALLNKFITVRNGNAEHLDLVRHGNEDVVRARFADAAYFFRADIQKPLEAYLTRLDTITFQGKLGSMLDKSKRIESLVEPIAHQLGVQGTDLQTAQKAARLCKADLATNMVVEITALQGQMGRDYHKLTSQEPDKNAVADAIFEHYLPRFAGDRSPATKSGLVVGLADKLDSIAGLFAVGLAPKGSADPFALRRAAIGIITNLLNAKASFSLREGLKSAAARLPVKMDDKALEAAYAFIQDRARVIFNEAGNRYDVVDAVLAEQGDNPHGASAAIATLNAAVKSEDWPALLAAYSRCARIMRSAPITAGPEAADPSPEAQALAAAVAAQQQPDDAGQLLANLRALVPAINAFFDKTMVMVDDEALKRTRLMLLGRIVAQASGLADLSKLEGF